MMNQDIRQLQYAEIQDYASSQQWPNFRAKQIYEWLWKKNIQSFNEMKNIPVPIKSELMNNYTFNTLEIVKKETSNDTTVKVLFQLFDDLQIEGVLIPSSNRVTACISTQAGCPLNCSFCATGKMGFKRNLYVGEIFDEYTLLNKLSLEIYKKPLTNIVLMGMGEPFLNENNVISALSHISNKSEQNFSPSRITISTIGFPEKILDYAKNKHPWSLAISLHSAQEEIRQTLIPASKKYSLANLKDSLRKYSFSSDKPVTIEYLMIKDTNTDMQAAKALIQFCSSFPAKINLINYNAVPSIPYIKAENEEVAQFLKILKSKNFNVTIRKSMGDDISAACGQLANNSKLVK